MQDRFEKLSTLYRAHITVLKLRHDRAMDETDFDHLVVFAGAQHIAIFDDYLYPFKVNPHFKWWVPVLDNPHCMLVYTPGMKPRLVYYQPVDYWYKPADAPSGWWTPPFDIDIIRTPEEAKKYIPTTGRVAFIGEWDEAFKSWGALEANPEDLVTRLHYDRAWKTEYEIECIRGANDAGARGHMAAEKAFREGESEFEIHIAYLLGTLQAEEELPYANIIALNEHGSVLHYVQHIRERHPQNRHSFLIDAGAQFNGYASDITRTYSEKKDEFRDLIQAMDAMQQSMCAEVQPKVNYIDLHMHAHRKIAQILADFKFVKDLDAGGIVEKHISSTFFPHGLGHFLGLQVHDVGGFLKDNLGACIPKPEGHPYLRLTRVVEPSHVFTLEPGLYFIETLLADLKKSDNAKYINWTKVDGFRKYGGIRIEDDVVVTDNGHENMTRQAFAQAK